jgi:hypothetical protein
MSFFFTTPAGAVDLVALLLVSAVAACAASRRGVVFAGAMCAVFLAHRALLQIGDLYGMMTAGGVADFLAILAVLALVPGRWGRSMAALFALKITAYAAVVISILSFDAMASAVTVLVYFQLLLILAAVSHDGFGKRLGRRGPAGPAYSHSPDIVAQRVQAERSVPVPSNCVAAGTPVSEKNGTVMTW